jgi:serine/threonine-protein kinase
MYYLVNRKIMKRIFYLVTLCLISFAVHCQTNNNKAKKYYDHGLEEVLKKNYTDAITDFSDAITNDPGFIQAYENRGVAKFYLKDYNGALEDYTKALEINPNDYHTLSRRGVARFYLRDYSGAIADYTKAIEGSRDNIQYYNLRGQAKYRLQDYEGAIADFSAVIKSWSAAGDQKSKAFYWRGLIKINSGQKEEGCSDLNQARKLGNPDANDAVKVYCK